MISKGIAQICVMFGATIILRFLPIWIFSGDKKVPAWIEFLGKVLPYSVVGMLVVYCLKDASFTSAPFAAPELIAVAAVALLHIWKKNMLISVGAGTVLYMILIRLF